MSTLLKERQNNNQKQNPDRSSNGNKRINDNYVKNPPCCNNGSINRPAPRSKKEKVAK